MWRLSGLATLIFFSAPSLAQEPFFVAGWESGTIEQGMGRKDVENILSRSGHALVLHPTLGATFDDGNRTYMLGFCDDELTWASWTLPNNTQFLRSVNQRVNMEGFEIFRTDIEGNYSDRFDSDIIDLTLHLGHPGGLKAFTITYHLYVDNAQIELRDNRYGRNCEPNASTK